MAQEFLQRMHMGFPDYHCEIQTSKTATNLTDDVDRIHTVWSIRNNSDGGFFLKRSMIRTYKP